MVHRGMAGFFLAVSIGILGGVAAEEGTPLVFECKDCNVSYGTRAGWAEHEIRAHGARGCLQCRVLLESDVEENAHRIVHHGSLECTSCTRTFSSREEATAHLVGVHHLERCDRHDLVFENPELAAEHARSCPFFQAHRRQGEERAAGKPAG